MAKKMKGRLGAWAFLIGVVLAAIFAFLGTSNTISLVLFIVGIIVGLFNVTSKEVDKFLIAGVVLVIISSFGSASLNITYVEPVLTNLLAIFVPATAVVALKSVFEVAKN